jgi:preprotein translocase subunit SecE
VLGVRVPPGLPLLLTACIGAEEPMIAKTNEFFANVKAELKKVTWPTRKDTYASSLVVIVLVLVSAIYLGGVDLILSRLVRMILG